MPEDVEHDQSSVPAARPGLEPTLSQSSISNKGGPSKIRPIVTEPPWAKDEPRSSADSFHFFPSTPPVVSRPVSRSDILSLSSSSQPYREHRWFPFTRKSTFSQKPSNFTSAESTPPDLVRQSTIGPLALPDPPLTDSTLRDSEDHEHHGHLHHHRPSHSLAHPHPHSRFRNWGLHVSLPQPPAAANTLAQSRTPGWESPWVPKISGPLGMLAGSREMSAEKDEELSRWRYFKKRARRYLLSNVYAPLLFRFINITLTTAALALAAQLRRIEKRETLRGSLGPSPTVVVVFAPLTLFHVMVAVYLEYFGRPLGLWRTSAKLAHTLVEVIFICLWSGAFALTINDYFAYFRPCSSLVQLDDDLLDAQGPDGTEVPCNHQVALVCLVAIGLSMYCFNLVISLFRIFEKVKVHHHGTKGVPRL